MSKYTDISKIEKYVIKQSKPIENIAEEFRQADFLLYSMLDYIIQVSTLPEKILLNVISLISAGGYKGKVTHLSDDNFIVAACNIMKTPMSIESVKSLNLTREVIEDVILSFMKETSDYLPMYNQSTLLLNEIAETGIDSQEYKDIAKKLLNIELRIGASRTSLPGAIRNVESLYSQYKDIKDRVIVAYLRKSLKKVAEDTYQTRNSADQFQNTVFGINKAFSLYRTEKGAFSSYLDFWIRFTLNEPPFHAEVGTVFYIPAGVKKRLKEGDREIVRQSYGFDLDEKMPIQEENDNDFNPLEDLVKHIRISDMPFNQRRMLGLKYSSLDLLYEKPKRGEVIQELLNQITIREGGTTDG